MALSLSSFVLYTLDVEVGKQPVRLFGMFETATSDGGAVARFALADALPGGVAANLARPGLTTTVTDPLGLSGVTLSGLRATGEIRRQGGRTAVDLTLRAVATFPSLPRFQLTGAVAFDGGAARLALVTLSATPPLTLTDALTSLFGDSAAWGAIVTDQFAFVSGELYNLQLPAGADPKTYTYTPPADQGGTPTVYRPGLHVEGLFRIFGRYDLLVRLGRGPAIDDDPAFALPSGYAPAPDDLTIVTTAATVLSFWIIRFDFPKIAIARLRGRTVLSFGSTLTVLGTSLTARLVATYDPARSSFVGSVTTTADGLSLTLGLRWDADEVHLGQIGGLDQDIARAEAFLAKMQQGLADVLNALRSNGCAEIVSGWLQDAATSKIVPSLGGNVTRLNDSMRVPFVLAYDFRVGDRSLFKFDIPFSATVAVPGSLDDFPRALWDTLSNSASDIAQSALRNPGFYQALAIEAGRRAGSAAFARFICRALKEAAEDVAKEIAEQAETLGSDTIAAVAELAGALVAVSLLGVKAVLSLFEEIWDDIKKLFGQKGKKDEAEDRIREIQSNVVSTIDAVQAKIDKAKEMMAIASLQLAYGGDVGSWTVIAAVTWRETQHPTVEEDGNLSLDVSFLTGNPGDAGGTVIFTQPYRVSSPTIALSDLGVGLAASRPGESYRMNARIAPVLKGVTFLDRDTQRRLEDAIAILRGLNDDVANDFAAYLAEQKQRLLALNTQGIRGGDVYVAAGLPPRMTVGRSHIGLDTRLLTAP